MSQHAHVLTGGIIYTEIKILIPIVASPIAGIAI